MTPDAIALLPYRPCVGLMLVDARGRVFVGQRSDRDRDAWQMPQGGIDPGEMPEAAAFRELGEETGLHPGHVRIEGWLAEPVAYDLPPDVVPTIWKGRYRGQLQHWVLLRFLGSDADIDIAQDHAEFSAWRWADPAELVPGIVPFKRAVYARVLTELGTLI